MNIITTEQKVVITSFVGKVYVMGPDGHQIELKVGDVLPKGTAIFVEDGGSVNTAVAIEADDLVQQAGQPGATPDDVAALQQAIADGVDPTKAFDATAAGAAAAGGGVAGASSNDGYVVVDMGLDQTLAEAGFETTHTEAIVADTQTTVADDPLLINATITLSAAASVAEGGTITYTASVDFPVDGSDLVLTLSNGATIVIAVGQTSGSITIAAPSDDVYVDSSTLTVSITGT
ncbi:MAG: retention module-containing protein, partial [Aeromonas sp.]